jgi:hypothetical protein
MSTHPVEKLRNGEHIFKLLEDNNRMILKKNILDVVLHYAEIDFVSPEEWAFFDMFTNQITVCEDYQNRFNQYCRSIQMPVIIYNRYQDLQCYANNFFSNEWYNTMYSEIVAIINDAIIKIFQISTDELDTSRLEYCGIVQLCTFAEALYNKSNAYFYEVVPYGPNFYPEKVSFDADTDDVTYDSGVTGQDELTIDSVKKEPVKVQPVQEHSVDKDVNESAGEQPVEERRVEEDVNESAGEQPVEECPVDKDVNDSAGEQPVEERPVDKDVNESAGEQPVEERRVEENVLSLFDNEKGRECELIFIIHSLSCMSLTQIQYALLEYCCCSKEGKKKHAYNRIITMFYVNVNTPLWSSYKITDHVSQYNLNFPVEKNSFEVFTLLFYVYISALNLFFSGGAKNVTYEAVTPHEFDTWIERYVKIPDLGHDTYYKIVDDNLFDEVTNQNKPVKLNKTGISMISETLVKDKQSPLFKIGHILEPLCRGERPSFDSLDEETKNDPYFIAIVKVACMLQEFFKEFGNHQHDIDQANIRESVTKVNYVVNPATGAKTNFFPEYKFPDAFKSSILHFFELDSFSDIHNESLLSRDEHNQLLSLEWIHNGEFSNQVLEMILSSKQSIEENVKHNNYSKGKPYWKPKENPNRNFNGKPRESFNRHFNGKTNGKHVKHNGSS